MGVINQIYAFLFKVLHCYFTFCVYYKTWILKRFYFQTNMISLFTLKLIVLWKNVNGTQEKFSKLRIINQIYAFLFKVLQCYWTFCVYYKTWILSGFYFQPNMIILFTLELVDLCKTLTGHRILSPNLASLPKFLDFSCIFCISTLHFEDF